MNKEAMRNMSAEELDDYGKLLGIITKAANDAEGKAALIERRRAKVAKVRVLGMDLDIPVKVMQDKRVAECFGDAATDESMVQGMELILGAEQWQRVIDAATDEDGTIDMKALALAYKQIIYADELKNY